MNWITLNQLDEGYSPVRVRVEYIVNYYTYTNIDGPVIMVWLVHGHTERMEVKETPEEIDDMISKAMMP